MVGYGNIHHRGLTLPLMNVNPKHGCRDEDKYFQSSTPNLNVLTRVIVGGPSDDGSF
jgi:hypothetical protein